MSETRRSTIAGLSSGALFAVGLALSGMTDPGKVLAFLDFFGAWDPSLAFVMVGAIGVHFAVLRWASRRAAMTTPAPSSARIDARLLLGAGVFGVGWGMSGYCPGPALVAFAAGRGEAVVFTLSMLAGMVLFNVLERRGAGRTVELREST